MYTVNSRATTFKNASSVQSLSRVRLFATPWIAAHQASLSITNSWKSLRLTSIESVMPSSHLILCRPLLLLPPIPSSIRGFQMSQLFAWGGQSTGVSALVLFLLKKSQGWSLMWYLCIQLCLILGVVLIFLLRQAIRLSTNCTLRETESDTSYKCNEPLYFDSAFSITH